MEPLPAPEVLRCTFDDGFQPPLPAMNLRWPGRDHELAERLWYLPKSVCLVGPAPARFGITIRRRQANAYAVQVLWDETYLSWTNLNRVELVSSALASLLRALGTDLWYLLDQPVEAEVALPRRAA
jgi:hypothetical protein